MTKQEFAKLFDHTLLKPEAKQADFEKLCDEATENLFFSVCVPPNRLRMAKTRLKNSGVKAITVVGFPLGYQTTKAKCAELNDALTEGADEIDFVVPVGKYLEGDGRYVLAEFSELRKCAQKTPLKVIVETALLSEEQLKEITRMCVETEMDFIKTSTGFSSRGASVRDIQLMSEAIRKMNSKMKIKASGGIKTLEEVRSLHAAGASRIGSSASVNILSTF